MPRCGLRSPLALCVFLAAAVATSSGPRTALAAGAASVAPELPTAVVCPSPPEGGDTSLVARLQETVRGLQGLGLVTEVTGDRGCSRSATLDALAPGDADLVTVIRRGGLETEPAAALAWIGFQFERKVDIQIFGRPFSGTLETTTVPAPRGMEKPLLEAMARVLIHSRLRARRPKTDADREAIEASRRGALTALAAADGESLASQAPLTSAVLKQLRALLLTDGSCEDDSPLDLFRAAARLVPGSATARTLAALARLQEAYEPNPCLLAAEQDLLAGVERDPWGLDAPNNLSRLYELSANARPQTSARQIAADLADERVAKIWKQGAPKAPYALELGAALGVSSALQGEEAGFGPGARIELSYGRDGRGPGARVGLSVPWTRRIEFDGDVPHAARVSWTRFLFDVGGRYRRRFWSTYAEIGAALVLGPVLAQGEGFDQDLTDVGFNVGGNGSFRIGRRFGRLGLWAGLSATYVVGTDKLRVRAEGTTHDASLPAFDLAALGGVSFYLLWTQR